MPIRAQRQSEICWPLDNIIIHAYTDERCLGAMRDCYASADATTPLMRDAFTSAACGLISMPPRS